MYNHRISGTRYELCDDAATADGVKIGVVCDQCGAVQPNAMAHEDMKPGWEHRPSEWGKRIVGCLRCGNPSGRYA